MKVVPLILLTLQLVAIVLSQEQSGGSGDAPSDSRDGNNSVQPTSSSNPVTSSADPQSSANPTDNPSASNSATNPAQSSDQQTPSMTTNTPTASTTHGSNDHSSTKDRGSQTKSNDNSNPTNGPTSSSSSTSAPSDNNSSSDNVGKIAGGVVGGVVGIALIGGLLTWLNRRGGCTSRTKRRHHDNMDDFALNTNDRTGDPADGSPFQRRMAPVVPGYMNMGNDEYSETTTAYMNRDRMAGYPSSHVPDSQYGHSDAHSPFESSSAMDPWRQEKQQHYGTSATSLQSPNVHDRRVKPDTVDYKPHEV